jgi:hypothetical protein
MQLTPLPADITRQQLRAIARAMAFRWISENWPGEPRRLRRAMGMARARLSWRNLAGAAPLDKQHVNIIEEQ